MYHQVCGEALQRMPNPRCCLCRVSIQKLTHLFFGADRGSAGDGIGGGEAGNGERDAILEKATIASLEVCNGCVPDPFFFLVLSARYRLGAIMGRNAKG